MEDQQLVDAHQAFDQPAPFTNVNNSSRRIPEKQVYSAREKAEWRLNGREITITGGFMEPYGHGRKPFSTYYLDSQNPNPQKPATRGPGNYNIGIDYVIGGNKMVTPWYGGEVVPPTGLNGGYGYSVTIKTNQSYEYNGKRYPIYNTYSHVTEIQNGIEIGSVVTTDTYLAKMGGTGSGGTKAYPDHLDFQAFITVDGKKVQISPNLMQDNLKKQQTNGTFHTQQNVENNIETVSNGRTHADINHSTSADNRIASIGTKDIGSSNDADMLKAQHKLILGLYSSDGTSTGDVDMKKFIAAMRNEPISLEDSDIASIASTYFEGKGFSEKQLSQQIGKAFDDANQSGHSSLASAGQSTYGLG
jgi:murein DD-endopeptidase MepM/ murein hydrolase activator NlpD